MWQLVKQTKQKSDHPSRFANNLSGYPAHYYTLQIFLMRIPSQHPAAACYSLGIRPCQAYPACIHVSLCNLKYILVENTTFNASQKRHSITVIVMPVLTIRYHNNFMIFFWLQTVSSDVSALSHFVFNSLLSRC